MPVMSKVGNMKRVGRSRIRASGATRGSNELKERKRLIKNYRILFKEAGMLPPFHQCPTHFGDADVPTFALCEDFFAKRDCTVSKLRGYGSRRGVVLQDRPIIIVSPFS